MTVRILESSDERKWDEFVEKSPGGSLFQKSGWKKVVENTYGHKSFYLLAEENKEIVGVLPLFLVHSLIFGKRLVSVPYGPYAGCSVNNKSIADSLFEKANEIAKSFKVKYIELRNIDKNPVLPSNDKHFTMILDLTQGENPVWNNLRKGMKACVNKSTGEELSYKLDSGNLKGFYSVYCRRMHQLGTPVPPMSFFLNISNNFPDMKIATIDANGEILAAQILLYFKKTVIYAWGASINNHSESHPVHKLLWKVIKQSIFDGYESFDFGRSALDSGTYDFKKWWGAQPKPLYYQYIFNNKQDVPYVHPSNPKYKMLIKIWQNLPLSLANRLGPSVSRELI